MNRLVAPIRNLLDRIRIQPAVHDRLRYWTYGPEFRRWCQSRPCKSFVTRTEMYQFLVESQSLDGPIDYLEFGVFQGDSMRWWVANSHHPESKFVGFDSFEGLPEEWRQNPKGTFSANGKVPEISDPRCSFVKGLFHDTVPVWLTGRTFPGRSILHLDADLYSSTLVALTQLLPKLRKNNIMIFDEFSDYFNEFRAYCDATSAYQLGFVPLCRTADWVQVGLIAS